MWANKLSVWLNKWASRYLAHFVTRNRLKLVELEGTGFMRWTFFPQNWFKPVEVIVMTELRNQLKPNEPIFKVSGETIVLGKWFEAISRTHSTWLYRLISSGLNRFLKTG